MIDLYVARMFYEWKIDDNLQWLERNVKEVIANESKVKAVLNENKAKYLSRVLGNIGYEFHIFLHLDVNHYSHQCLRAFIDI